MLYGRARACKIKSPITALHSDDNKRWPHFSRCAHLHHAGIYEATRTLTGAIIIFPN
jgi:hypothetical protein